MSAQRYTWMQVGEVGPKAALYITYADHARLVAEARADERSLAAERVAELGRKRFCDSGVCHAIDQAVAAARGGAA